jgi:hypothetical protein
MFFCNKKDVPKIEMFIAALLFNKSFFEKLGLEKVHPDEVCLIPSLLR